MLFPRQSIATLCVFAVLVGISRAEETKTPDFPTDQIEFFEKEVRPILAARCYECHSAKSDEIKGGLRVDSRSAAIVGGDTGAAIEPGDPEASLLIDAINYGDVYQMPPKSKITAKEIAVLTKWVKLGAPWPAEESVKLTREEFDLHRRMRDHWAWQPISSPEIPAVKNAGWPRNELDHFIAARLEEEGWQPASRADKRTLIRRVYFDLIGLPPTPAEVEAFLNDESPDAFRRVVDRLLESPRFGERWARHWLDLVRYAESRGHEFDYDAVNAHEYRDYLIRALNDDVPYDQFVIEHIAGDLLNNPRRGEAGENESIIGTGFWFLGEWVHSPVDIREDEASRFDNMIDVYSKTFLGMTVACARCHDHKFDAISQADYYAMQGFLQSSAYRQVRFESMLHNQSVAIDLSKLQQNETPAIAKATAKSLQGVIDQLDAYLLAARDVIQRSGDVAKIAEQQSLEKDMLAKWVAYLAEAKQNEASPLVGWSKMAHAPKAFEAGKIADYYSARKSRSLATAMEGSEVVVNYSRPNATDWMVNGPIFGQGIANAGDIVLSAEPKRPIAEIVAYGSVRRDPFWNGLTLAAGTQKEPGRNGGWIQAGHTMRTPTFTISRPNAYYLVRGVARVNAVVDSHRVNQGPLHGRLLTRFDTKEQLQWIGHNLDRYRGHGVHIEFSAEGDHPLEVLAVVQGEKTPPVPSIDLAAELASWAEKSADDVFKAHATAIQRRFSQASKRLADNSIATAADAELINWMLSQPALFGLDRSNEKAEPAKVAQNYFTERAKLFQQRILASRAAMAMWDGNAVNEHLFVRGNHKATGDAVIRRSLTALGDAADIDYGPTSGRLELAKKLISPENPLVSRVMVNRVWYHLFGHGLVRSVDNFGVLGEEPSHPKLLDYLATRFMTDRWSVKRLIRSIVLSSTYQMKSNEADPTAAAADPTNRLLYRQNMRRLEGEIIRDSILTVSGRLDDKMYGRSIPINLTNFMQGRGRPGSGPVDGQGRRSVYLSIRRNFLSSMMLAFDTPIPFTTVGRRNVSNVPAQALILLNDPFVAEEARRWAKRVLLEAGQPSDRVRRLYREAFAREASEREVAAALAFLEGQGAQYGLNAEQAFGDERVWSDLCHVLFNAKEFVFVR